MSGWSCGDTTFGPRARSVQRATRPVSACQQSAANTGPSRASGLVAAWLGRSGVARPPEQLSAVQDDDLAAAHLNQLAGSEPPEDLVRGRARGSGQAGQHFLGHGDDDVL